MVNIVVESHVNFLTKNIYAWSQQHFCKAMLPTLHNEKCIDQGDQNYLILYFSLQKFVQQTYRSTVIEHKSQCNVIAKLCLEYNVNSTLNSIDLIVL